MKARKPDRKTESESTGASPHDPTLPLPGYEDPEPYHTPSPPPSHIGPYRVVGELGHGGMGVVYAAEDPQLKRRIAIKVLPAPVTGTTALAHFRKEAQLLAALNHPNIATIHSLEEDPAHCFLTLELVDGETLASRLENGAMPLDEALPLLRQIAQALEAAHKKEVVHRDLKPLNIMVTPEHRVKVLDFGLATARGADDPSSGAIVGTPGYMSPEQVRGEPADARADLWAFGCIAYEVMTGHKLVPGRTASERMENTRVFHPDLEAHSDRIPARIAPLLTRCLETEVADRQSDMAEVRREIEEEIARRQLHARLPGDARSRESTPNNLPRQVSSFIGRTKEIAEVRDRIREHRLLTLTGPGGGGKTRLALEVAEGLLADAPDGVWLLELAPITDGSRIMQALAMVLDAKEDPERPLEEVVVDALDARRVILVLDNCEHVLRGSQEIVNVLLSAAPDLRILATSREPLAARGEAVYRVPSLPIPGDEKPGSPHALLQLDGIKLFVDRARDAKVDFSLTEANASDVARICRKLDGVPLALELAAAKARVLSVEEIANRLDESFALLAGGHSTSAARHQALNALIDWSHDLLTPAERAVFRRLAVFSGGWTLEAAEIVCSGDDIADWEVLDLHGRLVDKSLTVMLADDPLQRGKVRYRMLESVRAYARDRLEEAGELASTLTRHLDAYLELTRTAQPHLRGFEQATWLHRLGAEHANLRVAFDTCARDDIDAHVGLRLAGAIGRYWMVRGHWSEGRALCARVLERPGAEEPTLDRARTFNAAGNLAFHQGEYDQAHHHHEESLVIHRHLGDRAGEAMSLNNLGEIARMRGDHDAARDLYLGALAIQEDLDDTWGAAVSYNNLGEVEQARGEYDEARAYHDRALRLWPGIGDRWGLAWSLSNLGFVAAKQGRLAEARSFYERSLDASRELGDQFGISLSLDALGGVAERQGDRGDAREFLAESLSIRRTLGDQKGIAESLEAFARLAAGRDDPARAARLLGAAAALRERIRAPLPGDRHAELEPVMVVVRNALGEDVYRTEWDRGRAMFLDQATADALEGET